MRLDDLIPPGAETGAGLALEHRGRYLFMLAGRRHVREGEASFFAGIGGHREPGEDWLQCAHREAQEELGAEVEIGSAPETLYIPHEGVPWVAGVEDTPRPLAIYELWNPPGVPWNRRGEGYTYYIVVYQATLDGAFQPQPGDLEAILWLNKEQVQQAAREPVTLADLLAGGAEVAVGAQHAAPPPDHWRLRPQGTARALAALWESTYQSHMPD